MDLHHFQKVVQVYIFVICVTGARCTVLKSIDVCKQWWTSGLMNSIQMWFFFTRAYQANFSLLRVFLLRMSMVIPGGHTFIFRLPLFSREADTRCKILICLQGSWFYSPLIEWVPRGNIFHPSIYMNTRNHNFDWLVITPHPYHPGIFVSCLQTDIYIIHGLYIFYLINL